ncbi:MAG: DUF4417 domain-containing protein [Clostridia bacterium]|nr:DUF4417 domain-containing protein [Clostridia bacterium]
MPIYKNKEYIKLMRPIPSNWPLDIEGIPYVRKSIIDIKNLNNGKWMINISNAQENDKYAYRKIIHCFKENNELNRFYNNPFMFLSKIGPYYASSTLDYGMHPGMKRAQIIDATFKNRWSGVWQQVNGKDRVAVTVGWVYEDTYDICFAGIEDGTLLIISTLGVCNEFSQDDFLKGYHEMRKRFPSSQIICIGNKIEGMDEDICYIKYRQSFGNWDRYRNYWQPSMFNWNEMEVDENVFKG